jgi:hypothetical protein
MTQKVTITQPVRVGGSVLAAGTTQTLAIDVAADLVQRGFASPVGIPVWQSSGQQMVTVQTDQVSGLLLSASAGTKSIFQACAMVARSKGAIECVSNGECGGVSTTTTTNRTWQRAIGLRGVPLVVRVQYQNPTATAYTVDKTNIKLSTTYVANAGGGDPTGTMTPLNVLWSSAASIEAGAGSADAPAYTAWSDPLLLPVVDRTDGGTYPLAYIRSFIANGGATAYPYQAANKYANNPNNSINGLIRLAGFQAGDFITTPTGFTDVTGLRLCMNLEFTEFARGIKIASLGDSVTSNNAANGGDGGAFRSMIDIALELINPTSVSYGTILSHSNCGVSSTTLSQVYGRLSNILTNQTPDIVILPTWSTNTAPTTKAALDAYNAIVLQGITKVLAAGAVPILWTGPPQNGTTAAVDALRVSNNAYWKSIANYNGFYVVDTTTVWDGEPAASVTQWVNGLTTDGTHPNLAGNVAAAAVFAPIIKAAAGLT